MQQRQPQIAEIASDAEGSRPSSQAVREPIGKFYLSATSIAIEELSVCIQNGLWLVDISALQLRLISAAQCRAYAVESKRLGKAAEISIERATALISMAHSWDALAEDMARYEAIVKAEARN
jgi:hypothetical protein